MSKKETQLATATSPTWFQAYRRFLLSKDENFILKIAPLLLLIGSPEILVSNLIPVVGELADLGTLSLITITAVRTYSAVRKYRSTSL